MVVKGPVALFSHGSRTGWLDISDPRVANIYSRYNIHVTLTGSNVQVERTFLTLHIHTRLSFQYISTFYLQETTHPRAYKPQTRLCRQLYQGQYCYTRERTLINREHNLIPKPSVTECLPNRFCREPPRRCGKSRDASCYGRTADPVSFSSLATTLTPILLS